MNELEVGSDKCMENRVQLAAVQSWYNDIISWYITQAHTHSHSLGCTLIDISGVYASGRFHTGKWKKNCCGPRAPDKAGDLDL